MSFLCPLCKCPSLRRSKKRNEITVNECLFCNWYKIAMSFHDLTFSCLQQPGSKRGNFMPSSTITVNSDVFKIPSPTAILSILWRVSLLLWISSKLLSHAHHIPLKKQQQKNPKHFTSGSGHYLLTPLNQLIRCRLWSNCSMTSFWCYSTLVRLTNQAAMFFFTTSCSSRNSKGGEYCSLVQT